MHVRRLLTLTVALLMLFPLLLFNYFNEGNAIKSALYAFSSFYFLLNFALPISYMFGVNFRLITLSQILKTKFRENQKLSSIKAAKPFDDAYLYETLTSAYNEIIKVCGMVSRTYGFQLMLCYGVTFFYTLFITFTVYTDYIDMGYLTKITQSSLGFCLFYNCFVVAVIVQCEVITARVSWNPLMQKKIFQVNFCRPMRLEKCWKICSNVN